jgi:Sulfotransferase family
MIEALQGPVAIGGLGGSGTRAVAEVFKNLGFYIGDDLNGALDNLWFTLLFKRRSILLESDANIALLYDIFRAKMSGIDIAPRQEGIVHALATHDRIQHDQPWLMKRAETFMSSGSSRHQNQAWAWKEPNTHISIDRLLRLDPELSYIHVVRDPKYMVISKNMNQLINWGPVFFSRDDAVTAERALFYWCKAHQRIIDIEKQFPNRISFLNYDDFCVDPAQLISPLLTKLGIGLNATNIKEACKTVEQKGGAPSTWDQSLSNSSDTDWAEQFFASL